MERMDHHHCYINNNNVTRQVTLTVPATITISVLSLLGSLLIILTFVLWKDVRKSTARVILLFLAIADLGTAAGYLVAGIGFYKFYPKSNNFTNDTSYNNFCEIQSFFTTFFPVSSFFWTASLAIYFVVILVIRKPRWGLKLLIIFNIVNWGLPFIICVIAVSLRILGPGQSRTSAAWCFVAEHNKRFNYTYNVYLFLEAVCGKGWEILAYIVVLVCYVIIVCSNRCRCYKKQGNLVVPEYTLRKSDYIHLGTSAKEDYRRVSQALAKTDLKLFFIPIVFICLRCWGTIRYFISMSPECHPHHSLDDCKKCYKMLYDPPVLLFLQSMCDPAQGFGNVILFVFLSKVILFRLLRGLYNCLTKCCCCFSQREKPRSVQSESDPFITTHSKKNKKTFVRVKYSPAVSKRSVENGETASLTNDSLSEVDIKYGSLSKTPSISSINST